MANQRCPFERLITAMRTNNGDHAMTDADMIKLAAAFGADKAREKAESAENWAGKLLAMAEYKALASLCAEIDEIQACKQEGPREAAS